MKWRIEFYSEELKQEILAFPPKIVAKTIHVFEMIEEFGADLGEPLTSHLEDGLFEIRVGTAKVVLEDSSGKLNEFYIHENESTYVPKTKKHRLINEGKVPLEIIEIQVGEYIGEDDIIRFDDKYGRE